MPFQIDCGLEFTGRRNILVKKLSKRDAYVLSQILSTLGENRAAIIIFEIAISILVETRSFMTITKPRHVLMWFYLMIRL